MHSKPTTPCHVLVTGGAGFIGRHLTRELLEHGYRVRVLDALVEQVHAGSAPERDARAEHIDGDVRDPATVRDALNGIEAVVHLAAEVGVGQSMYEIARYVGGNDLGTAVLLEQMIERPVAQIIVASSMSVYGEGLYRDPSGGLRADVRRRPDDFTTRRWDPRGSDGAALSPLPTSEDKPVDLASIYALTKFAQERAVMIFAGAYRRKAAALRLFNVFGPGQALSNPYTGVLANFASRIAHGERPMVFEDGRQRRDFVHVSDVARAFRLALERPQADGAVINIGSGRSYAIEDVALMLASAMGREDLAPEILGRARAGDIRHCFADIARARDLLGFEPRHRLEDRLDELAAWVAGASGIDRGAEMRRQLEERGLVT